jgi:hypothetical protein
MGGARHNAERMYSMDSLVLLCRPCHEHVHAHPAESYEQGWLVHTYDDPAGIPVPEMRKYDF